MNAVASSNGAASGPGRGLIEGLANPHPLGLTLPGLYQEDDFTQRFTSAFDDALAPVLLSLDTLAAYLDPLLTPEDFLEWLSGWIGVALDENWPVERRRELVAESVELYRWRGTARGIREQVRIFTGASPEIEDPGGVAWSTTPNHEIPGKREARFTIEIDLENAPEIEETILKDLVEAIRPAHMIPQIEVSRGKRPPQGRLREEPSPSHAAAEPGEEEGPPEQEQPTETENVEQESKPTEGEEPGS